MSCTFSVDRLKPVTITDGYHEYVIDLDLSSIKLHSLRGIVNAHHAKESHGNCLIFEPGNIKLVFVSKTIKQK